MAKRAIAYIDGFNFYHGVVRDRPELKWLNFLPLCERLLRGHHLAAINYYTARVVDRPEDPRQSQRQDSYLRVLENTDRVNVVYGQFQKKPLKVATRGTNIVPMVEGGTGSIVPGTLVKATTYEDKGSDVNLATDLSFDAATNQMAVALVLTNDFDIQHAVTRAMAIGVEVIIVNPHNRTSGKPSIVGSDTRTLGRKMLRDNQYPDVVTLADGTKIFRPATWS